MLTSGILATVLLSSQQNAKFVKIDDNSLVFAQTTLKNIQNSGDQVNSKLEKFKPVMSGYFYFRGQNLANLPFSNLEKIHAKSCFDILNIWYPGTKDEWAPFDKQLMADEKLTTLPEPAKEYLSKNLRKKILDDYLSFDLDKKVDPTKSSEFFIGGALGELSSLFVTQYTLGGAEVVRKDMNSKLAGIEKSLKETKGTPFNASIRQKILELTAIKTTGAFPYDKYPELEKRFKAVQTEITKL